MFCHQTDKLVLYEPHLKDLWFKQAMMSDEDTMSYNMAWGGTIPFLEDRWGEWYKSWIADAEQNNRYYRYLVNNAGLFVGEIAYHLDPMTNRYFADVIIHSAYRNRGYGEQALDLLLDAARQNKIESLYDEIALDNPAAALLERHGFSEISRNDATIMLKCEL